MADENAQWFYAAGSERKGPVPAAAIGELLGSGGLGREALVWTQGMAGWEPLHGTPLAELFPAPPPPPLPPVAAPPPMPAIVPPPMAAPAPPPMPASVVVIAAAPMPLPAPMPMPAASVPDVSPTMAVVADPTPPVVGPASTMEAEAEGEPAAAMRYEINGTVMQTVSVALAAGEQLFSQTSAMAWMTDTIRMDTHTGGGLMAGLARSVGGGSFFITDFTAEQAGAIAFAPRFPGTILPFRLGPGQSLICRKETFLFAQKSVTLEIAWQRRFGAGLFGGEGFILQKVTGPGTAWLDLSGEVIEKELAPGERLLVHAGHVGIQSPTVQFDIQMVKGVRNVLFGGEGLFLATLTGPGRVWLQSMPIMNLAEEIGRYLPQKTSETVSNAGSAIAAATAVGGVLGTLFGGKSSDS